MFCLNHRSIKVTLFSEIHIKIISKISLTYHQIAFDLFYEIRLVGCADDGRFTVYGFMLQKHAPARLRTQRSLSSCFGARTSSSHLAFAKCRRPQTVFPHKPINREPTTDTFPDFIN